MKRAVLYTRVSTFDQNPETQALDLRRLAEQRGVRDRPRVHRPDQWREGEAAGTRSDARRGPPQGV